MQTLETERLKYWAEVIMLDPRFCGATGQGAYWAVANDPKTVDLLTTDGGCGIGETE